jgi:hypothetical protein
MAFREFGRRRPSDRRYFNRLMGEVNSISIWYISGVNCARHCRVEVVSTIKIPQIFGVSSG